MYSVSEKFTALARSNKRQIDIRVIVGNKTYTSNDIIGYDIEDSLIAGESFTLGVVVASKLTLSLRTEDVAPSNARIVPEVRMWDEVTKTWTEWVKMGTFYIDERVYKSGVYSFTAYDRLILSAQTYVSGLTYPATMQSIMNEISVQLQIPLDSSVVINPSYTVDYKDEDVSIRQMLGYIASSHGASIRLKNDTEKIAFVKLGAGETTDITADHYYKLDITNPTKTYTKVLCVYNTDGEFFQHGSGGSENTLEFFNPHITESMLQTIYNNLNGVQYTPMTMDWIGFPHITVGDKIRVTDRFGRQHNTIILVNKQKYHGGLITKSDSPAPSPQQSEFRFEGSLTQTIKNIARGSGGLQESQPYYGVSIGRIYGLKVTRDDDMARVILNADEFKFQQFDMDKDDWVDGLVFDEVEGVYKFRGDVLVERPDGLGRILFNGSEFAMQVWDEQKQDWINGMHFDPENGQYVFNGVLSAEVIEAVKSQVDVSISNTFITQTLSAEKGYIAELTVDSLETSTKVQNYLRGDTGLVQYIRIEGQAFDCITAETDGQTEQAKDRRGRPLYWIDDDYKGTTFQETDFPVMIYKYTEVTNFKIDCVDADTQHPVVTLGRGDGVTPMSSKGRIYKDRNGVVVEYFKSNTGDRMAVLLSDEGIVVDGNTGSKGLRNIAVSSSPPQNPQNNDLWIDTTGGA